MWRREYNIHDSGITNCSRRVKDLWWTSLLCLWETSSHMQMRLTVQLKLFQRNRAIHGPRFRELFLDTLGLDYKESQRLGMQVVLLTLIFWPKINPFGGWKRHNPFLITQAEHYCLSSDYVLKTKRICVAFLI